MTGTESEDLYSSFKSILVGVSRNSESTGGKSGSGRMTTGGGINIQVKKSPHLKILRRIFNAENNSAALMAELISTDTMQGLLTHESGEEIVPNTVLVQDPNNKGSIILGSQYLTTKEGEETLTLDQFGTKHLGMTNLKGHVHLKFKPAKHDPSKSGHQESKTYISANGKSFEIDKKEIYRDLFGRALVEDNDCNPGNIVLKIPSNPPKGKTKVTVCHIDYGHAFGDLTKFFLRRFTPAMLIPWRIKRGPVLESLNTKTINFFKESKYYRDYSNFTSDKDFADVLMEDSLKGKDLKKILQNPRSKIENLFGDKDTELATKKNVASSIQTICERLGTKVPYEGNVYDKNNAAPFLDRAFEVIQGAIEKNNNEKMSVGRILRIQQLIKEAAHTETKNLGDIASQIATLYRDDNENGKYFKGKTINDKIEWVREGKNSSLRRKSLLQIMDHVPELRKKFEAEINKHNELPTNSTITSTSDKALQDKLHSPSLDKIREVLSKLRKTSFTKFSRGKKTPTNKIDPLPPM